jgi:hypothetical protein
LQDTRVSHTIYTSIQASRAVLSLNSKSPRLWSLLKSEFLSSLRAGPPKALILLFCDFFLLESGVLHIIILILSSVLISIRFLRLQSWPRVNCLSQEVNYQVQFSCLGQVSECFQHLNDVSSSSDEDTSPNKALVRLLFSTSDWRHFQSFFLPSLHQASATFFFHVILRTCS